MSENMTLADILLEGTKAERNFQIADQFRAYRAITEQHGPSRQLVEFINFDGKLGFEIGMEDFEMLSPEAQHEILLLRVKQEDLDGVATESFGGFLKKARGWLLAAGGAAFWLGGLSPLALGLLAAGVAGFAIKAKDSEIPTFASFTAVTKEFDAAYKVINAALSKMPSDNKESSWKKFSEEVSEGSTFSGGSGVDVKKSIPSSSGWNPTNITAALKWYEDTVDKLESARKTLGNKTSSVEQASSGEASRYINESMRSVMASMHGAGAILKQAKTILDGAAKAFEAKKKKD